MHMPSVSPIRIDRAPFSTDLIRWLEYLNQSWPHAQHQLYNGAMAATALSSVARCLSNHLPPTTQQPPLPDGHADPEATTAAASTSTGAGSANATGGGPGGLPNDGTAGVPDLIIL